MSHHGFSLDLFKERSCPPPPPTKLEVRSCRGLWTAVENRVSAKFAAEEAGSDESEGTIALMDFKDWWQPRGAKAWVDGKGILNPICVGIWSCSSNKLWLTLVWDVVDIISLLCSCLSFPFSTLCDPTHSLLSSYLSLPKPREDHNNSSNRRKKWLVPFTETKEGFSQSLATRLHHDLEVCIL